MLSFGTVRYHYLLFQTPLFLRLFVNCFKFKLKYKILNSTKK